MHYPKTIEQIIPTPPRLDFLAVAENTIFLTVFVMDSYVAFGRPCNEAAFSDL